MDTPSTVIPTVPPAVYTIKAKLGADHKWYWHMVAANGRIVADGSEGYSTKNGCERAIVRIVGASLVGQKPIKG